MSLLIIGATGTLGRQIVKKALDEGFQVTCLVRNLRKATFLKEWGARLVYGDLNIPDTIPKALYGITAVIDTSTSRSNDSYNTKKIDLKGKLVLIEAAEKACISRYIFFSILSSKYYTNIPLMYFKTQIENRLINSTIHYTIFYLCGFFQGLITQYALPILDKQSVWITNNLISIPYIDTQDVAKFTILSLSMPSTENKLLPLIGCKSWSSNEIIILCEKLSGQRAIKTNIPYQLLEISCQCTKLFQWSWKISERLSFNQIFNRKEIFNNYDMQMRNICLNLNINWEEIISLEDYLQEYFSRVMKKLKTFNYQIVKDNISAKF
uniref:NmrA-like domain-containing protein n=2 Tax=Thorea hispida TaxID=202687 RepID=A0A1C9CAF3_9FLOR|nr:hypothetical protein Thor_052 [Thorea hispida]AOM65344.1 hypothetical protein Thor_052 [Thorea hispida]